MSPYGVYFDYYSVNNTLTSNTLCSNSQYDIYASTSASGTGLGNTCDYPSYYWNDNGTSDCTSRCGAAFTTTTTTTTTSTSSTSTSSTTSTTSTTTTIFSVVINEFMASPPGADDASKPNGEWVELYNNGTLQQNLASWYLTENGGALNITAARTDTGNTLIAPQAFLVVYRDGATSFDLSDTTDNITLWTASSLLMDSVSYNVTQLNASWSTLPENTSVGRSVDGSGMWTTYNASTAGRSNLGSQTTQHALVSGWNLISLPLNL